MTRQIVTSDRSLLKMHFDKHTERQLICTNGKRDSGAKFTSPELCEPFTHTMNRPVCPCRLRALSIYEKNPEISVVAKVEFPIGKKLFHLVVNPGTWPGARPWTWNWYKLQETSMEHDIPFGNSNRENGTTFLDFPLFLGIFQWDEPTKRVPFTAEPEIPEILTKWKAPSVFHAN